MICEIDFASRILETLLSARSELEAVSFWRVKLLCLVGSTTAELISFRFFDGSCDRRVVDTTAPTSDGRNFQLSFNGEQCSVGWLSNGSRLVSVMEFDFESL